MRLASIIRPLLAGAAALLTITFAGAGAPLLHAQSTLQVIASGLDNPRKLAFGPDGALYVAEAGRGGTSDLCSIDPGTGANRCYGPSGAITRITGIGVHSRVVSDLPSIAPADGNNASGPHDIDFGFGAAWVLIGYGGDPLERTEFEAAGIRLGSLVRVDGVEQWAHVLDVSDHEITNPDGDARDSHPFGMSVLSNRIVVADAGANALLHIGLFGQISTHAVFPERTVGSATIESVPTTVIEGPDGSLFVGELTGAPFPVGAARVYRVPAGGGTPVVVATGFTTIIDIALDSVRGFGYVLEHDADGIIPPLGPGVDGRLIQINLTNGTQTVLAQAGLVKPGGVAVGPEGALYVTTRTNFAGLGEVVRIVP
jgi:hypothetical protein